MQIYGQIVFGFQAVEICGVRYPYTCMVTLMKGHLCIMHCQKHCVWIYSWGICCMVMGNKSLQPVHQWFAFPEVDPATEALAQ